MATWNFKIAKDVLSDKDKDRLVCLYLNKRPDGSIDWDKATADFECASVSSMKVMTNSTLKKIENAGGKIGAAAATPKKVGGKKRKVTSDGDDDEEVTLAPKKGRKKGKTAEAAVDSIEEDAANVKTEVADEDDGAVTT